MALSYTNVNGLYIPDNGVYKNVTAIIAPKAGSNIDLFPSQYVNTLDPDPTVTGDECILIRKFRNVSGGYCAIINNSGNSVEFKYRLPSWSANIWSGTTILAHGDANFISLGTDYGIFIKGAADSSHTDYGLCKKYGSVSDLNSVTICLKDSNSLQSNNLESIVSGKLASLLPSNPHYINTDKGPFPQMFSSDVIDATFLDFGGLPGLARICAYLFYKSDLKFSPIIKVATLSDSMFTCAFAYSPNLKIVRCYSTDISANDCTKDWLVGNESIVGTFVKSRGVNWSAYQNGSMENYGWTQKYSEDTDIYNNL